MNFTKGQQNTSFGREVEVIPRSDFQTAFPKDLCLEGCQGSGVLLPTQILPQQLLDLFYNTADPCEIQLEKQLCH